MLLDFMDYATKQNLSIASGENYCPLIVYSPKIKGNVQIDELCYQMDVFPTILHLIGCEGYYWKGFGVNLLDSAARKNRPITEQEAYILSEKIIRANYFGTITQ
jgi:phosphoglycerol transferase MdoB-like AlkP superfamily enzyme